MYFFAMDLDWKRVPILLILLIFWKHAVGHKGWSSQDVQPQWEGPVHKVLSPRGAQSSVLEAPVTGSIPFEEVASVFARKSLNANRSRSSLLRQYVKGGVSSSYESMSHTQSAPKVSAFMVLPQNQHGSDNITSLLQLQGSFSPSVQDIASQTGQQLGEASSPLSAPSSSSTGSSGSSLSNFTYTPQGSSGSQQAGTASSTAGSQGFQTSGASQSISQSSSSLFSLSSASTDGSSLQLQGTSSQYAPAALDAKVPVYSQAAPSGSSLSLSQPSQLKPSTSRWSQGFQATGTVASQSISQSPSRLFSLSSASTDGSSLQLQGTSSQYAPAALYTKVYSQTAQSGSSSSLSQPSQLKPSTSRWSQGFQATGTVASQGFQTSGTETSQSSSLSQGSKAPSRFSTLTSAASPGQFASTQEGSGRYSGLSSQSQSSSSQYSPGSPAYVKYGSSFIDASSQATRDQSPLNLYASSSQSRAGTQLAGSSRYVPTQTGSTFTDGSSLQLQGTSSQYAPGFAAKVPVSSLAAPSGSSSSLTQPSQLKPSTSHWSQGFQATGTVASQGFQTSGTTTSQSSSLSQGSKAPSRFSTLTSAASPGQFASIQEGSSSYSGLSSQSQSASGPYSSGSPAYAKYGSSFIDSSSQATRDQSSLNLYASSSQSRAGTQLAGSSRYVPTQTGSTFTDGSSLQLQGTSSQYAPVFAAKVPGSSLAAPSGSSSSLSQPSQLKPSTSRWSQGFQASGTVASQSISQSPSRLFSLSSASTDGSSRQLQGTSSQYAPAALDAKVYSQAAPSGSSSSLTQPSQLKPSTSRWSQGFQATGTVASQGFQTSGTATSQSSSLSQGSKAPSRFSTLTSASPGQFTSTQEGSGRYSGLSSQSQSASSQYSPGSPAYVKYGSSFIDASSQATRDQSSLNLYASSSQSRAGTQLAGSSRYVPTQTGSTSTDGSSLQLQGTSSQYAPVFAAKVPVSSPAAPSGSSLSLIQPSQLNPSTSHWSQGFQASGTMTSQSSSLSQGSKSPSRFSTLTSAASPGQFASIQEGSSYSGLSSQSQSASGPYSSGSPAYAKYGSSFIDSSSQATRDQSSLNLYASSSQSRAGTQLAGSSRYVPTQTGSTFTDGSSLQLQGTSSQYAPVFAAKVPVSSLAAPSGSSSSLSQPSQLKPSTSRWSQGFQASGTVASQSISQSPSRLFSLSSASTDGSSLQLQGTSSQYAPAALDAKVYSQAAPSGSSSSLTQPSQLNPSTSRWSQGFQASGTMTSQSSSLSQGSKSPSRFSTLTSSPSQFASTQEGSGRYSGLSSQYQSASSQYRPGSPAYAKPGSFLDSSSQSSSDKSAFDLYASSSQSRTGTQLAGPSRYVPTQTGSTLSQLQPSASSWSQGFQASGTAVSQSSSSPQTPEFSSGSSMSALSPPVDSVAQSSQSSVSNSWRTPSLSGVGLQPSMLSSQTASGSVTSFLGSNVQTASQGMISGQSSDSTSVVSSRYASTYGQKPSAYSRPSQSSSASGRYVSSVKG